MMFCRLMLVVDSLYVDLIKCCKHLPRYLGFRKTMLLDRRKLIELIDQYHNGHLNWHDFSLAVKEHHSNYTDSQRKRMVIADRPKEEDYFYANPEECLG